MHSVSKMRSFLSCHFPPPSSLTKLPPLSSAFHFRPPSPRSQHRTLYYSRTTVSLRSKPPAFASRTCCSSVPVDGGHLPPSSGEIHVIVGPMFAGKTTALLRRVQSESSNGRRVAMIKSNKDNRYGLDSVVTHDGVKMPCWALSELSTFRATIGAEAYEKLDVIGVDEAQFFEDLYDFCSNAADHDGKAVIVAGLDGDYLRRNFGSVIDIIPLADSVTKLTARCEVCGKRAFFTLRKTEETKTEVIGGADIYMPVCRQHYVDGQVVIKAARHVLESRKVQLDSSYLQAASLPN